MDYLTVLVLAVSLSTSSRPSGYSWQPSLINAVKVLSREINHTWAVIKVSSFVYPFTPYNLGKETANRSSGVCTNKSSAYDYIIKETSY